VIEIGEYQILEVIRDTPHGLYLIDDDDDEEVLMPGKFVTEDMHVKDKIKVFVYNDSKGRLVATTEEPALLLDQYAYLLVVAVNEVGAFCEWGVSKQLFIPFRNQATKLREGEYCVVHLYLDEKTDRLVGTTKLNPYLEHFADEDIDKGEEVPMLVYQVTDIGYKVIIDNYYSGLIYKSETDEVLQVGQKITGYVKPFRKDHKIDISLSPLGYQNIEPNAQKILEKLKAAGGSLPLNDKTDPVIIREELGMSKKVFKKAIGSLYKSKTIELVDKGIQLVKKESNEEA